jgi:integrase
MTAAARMDVATGSDPAAIRRVLLDRLRQELDTFDVETAAYSAAEREARGTALEVGLRQAEIDLVMDARDAAAEAFIDAALAGLGTSLQALGGRQLRFARVEGLRAWCDLLLLEAESARDATRIFPLRAEVLARRQAVLRPQDDALAGTGALSLATLRQMQGFTAEDGDLRLSDVYRRFLAAGKAEGKWKRPDNTARRDYGPIFGGFVAVAGDCRLAELTVSHARRYAEAVKAGAATTSATKAKYLDRVAAVLCWARDQGMVHDVTGPLRMTPTYRSYEAFTTDELQRLFESAAYRDVTFAKGAEFWAPLIALYTGARVNEIAGIRLDEIGEEGGTLSVLLSPEGRRTGKNDHSRRRVPVHPALIGAGLRDYLAVLAREGQAVLFPEIGCAMRDGKGKRITDDFQAYRRACGVGAVEGRGTKTFHSFRATLTTALQRAGVSGEVRRAIVGHAPADVHERTYCQGELPLAAKAEALAKVRFEFVHPRWRDTAAQRRKRMARRAG